MACLSPLDSAIFIRKNSKFVTINQDAIPQLAKMIDNALTFGEYSLSSWNLAPLHPKEANQHAVDWIFLVDSLNFSFWTTEEAKYKVTFEGQTYTGYWALCAAINRALQEGVPVTSADYLSSVTLDQVKKIFKADDPIVNIPLLVERRQVMNCIGTTLNEKFDGSFVSCVRQCQGSVVKLLDAIVDSFPSYRDQGIFQGETVSFYKRAQILIGDIWACFGGQGLGSFHDIDQLTMFADYRVPQVLVHFAVLKYNDELMDKLKQEELLENGSREEMEIRGCSIWAVELLNLELRRLGRTNLNSVQLDYYLWDYRREHSHELESIPYHRTRCIYY